MTAPFPAASQLAVNVLDAHSLLAAFGVLGVAVVMFAETGLLVGFFLPGDSLLFTAGLLCTGSAQGSLHLSLGPLLVAAAVGALAGAQCGYLLGRKAGGALLARSHSSRMHEERPAPVPRQGAEGHPGTPGSGCWACSTRSSAR
ncbi:hypothetical protein ABZ372_33355, partial [Streptomyces sp. NPDC005921]